MSRFSFRVAAIVGALGCWSSAYADSITFQQGASPSAGYTTGGVTIRSDISTNQNTGGQFDQIIFGKNGSNTLRGLLEFDLSALEAAVGGQQYVINSVALTVNTFPAGSGGSGIVQYDLDLLGNNLDFDEGTVTWNTAPSGAGGTVGTFLSSVSYIPNTNTTNGETADVGFHTFGDTSAFRSAVQGVLNTDPGNTIRLMLKAHSESQSIQSFTRIYSDEAAAIETRPALTIDYSVITPLPGAATAGLVLLGGVGVCRSSRRRR